jgi:hypothetical protein
MSNISPEVEALVRNFVGSLTAAIEADVARRLQGVVASALGTPAASAAVPRRSVAKSLRCRQPCASPEEGESRAGAGPQAAGSVPRRPARVEAGRPRSREGTGPREGPARGDQAGPFDQALKQAPRCRPLRLRRGAAWQRSQIWEGSAGCGERGSPGPWCLLSHGAEQLVVARLGSDLL